MKKEGKGGLFFLDMELPSGCLESSGVHIRVGFAVITDDFDLYQLFSKEPLTCTPFGNPIRILTGSLNWTLVHFLR